jgi:hypothetical protein
MAVPHYTYLVLKMSGSNGIITVKGSFELSDICDKEFHKMVQTFGTTALYGGTTEKMEHKTSSTTSRPLYKKTLDNTPEANKIWVHTKDPNNSTPYESGSPTA